MGYSDDQLDEIFNKTHGYCYHCGAKLAWGSYGIPSAKGSWKVDDGTGPVLRRTGHPENPVPSCLPCNRTRRPDPYRDFHRMLELSRRSYFSSRT